MVHIKTSEEIEIMRTGGQKLRAVTTALMPQIKVGMTTNEVDQIAEKLILQEGGTPSFKTVPGYHWSTCLPINEQVVHTPPKDRVLQNGDVLTVDVGIFYKGFHTDWATTIVVGGQGDPDTEKFLAVGKQALAACIEQAKVGRHIGHISEAIQKIVYGAGYFSLHELTGHGVGRTLHEDPFVPGYLDRRIEKTPKIKAGMVLALEVIYSTGTEKIAYEKGDTWSIVTADGSLSACFEETVAISDKDTFILS